MNGDDKLGKIIDEMYAALRSPSSSMKVDYTSFGLGVIAGIAVAEGKVPYVEINAELEKIRIHAKEAKSRGES